MANEFIIRKGYKSLSDSQITGSLSVSNAVTASFFTGSFRGDGSELTGIDGFPFTGSASISGSLTVVGPVTATEFIGNGSQLTGIDGFPFTGSAAISGSLTVDGNVIADSFTGSIQGTATTASYVNIANVDGFTAYSSSVNTAIGSVLDATTPITATINNTNSPFTITNQTIVIVDSTNGNVTVNLPDLDTVVGTPNQRPIIIYKNDYSQNVVYVQPNGSELVNGSSQDIIVSIQLAVIYNPTSAGWVTEGTSAQSLAELELFFVPRTETGSLSVATASYVEYTDVVNKPTLVSGSSQISFSGITNKPTLVSGSSQITYSGLTGKPSGIVSSSVQIKEYNVFATTGSNGFNGNQSITGSLTVTGQVVAQTLNVQQVTSSIVYSSGSNIFGNNSGNTHRFTGSLAVTGSLTVAGAGTFSNFVGINGSPGTSFPLEAYINSSTTYTASSRGNVMRVYNSNTTANIFAGIELGGAGTANDGLVGINGVVTGSGNGAMTFYTRNSNTFSEKLRLDSAGNLGLGVTPSAWNSAYRAIQFGTTGAIFGESGDAANYFTTNTFVDSVGFKYITSDWALGYFQENGVHSWRNAPSGTAGNAISFTQAMTLNASGRLGIGETSPVSSLVVSTPSDTSSLGSSGIVIQGSSTLTAGNVMALSFTAIPGTTRARAAVGSVVGSDWGKGNLTFYTRDASDSTALSTSDERMRITSDGNFLVGSTNADVGGSVKGAIIRQNGSIVAATNISSPFHYQSPIAADRMNTQGDGLMYGMWRQGIFQAGIGATNASVMTFFTGNNDSMTERMRIASGGNVGIGTNNPSERLEVNGSLRLNDGNADGPQLKLASSGYSDWNIDNFSGNLRAYYGSTEYMRITSGGDVLIGMTSASGAGITAVRAGLLSGQRTASTDAVFQAWNQATSGDNQFVHFYTEGGGGSFRGSIDFNRGAGLVRYNTSSDYRLKSEIEDFNASEIVVNLKPKKYRIGNAEQKTIGFIAHELQEYYPQAVSGIKDQVNSNGDPVYQGVDYSQLTGLLVKAIQEQQSQIEILKAEIQTLKQ